MKGTLVNLLAVDRERAHTMALRTPAGPLWTYGELEAASTALAQQLVTAGVCVGDRVLYQVQKSAQVVILHLALLKCGAVQVPINPEYPEPEVARFIADCEPVLVIRDAEGPHVDGPWTTVTLDVDGGGSVWQLPHADAMLPDVSPSDAAAILFTSGTTGRPKGAVLTHGNLVHNATSLIDAWQIASSDHLLHVLPLFHTHGLFVALHTVLGAGGLVTVLPNFVAATVATDIARDPSITLLMGVPTHYSRLIEQPSFDRTGTAALRLLVSGSAPMTPGLHDAIRARTGHQVLERYGMTETSMLTSNPIAGVRVPGSVGRPLPGVKIRLADTDDAASAAQPVGAVEVRGPNVFDGYWRRPDLRETVFTPDGWFRTGDLGWFDEAGYLHLVGRSKDVVISGGLNVYPADVERALDALPGVRESAVVGTADEDLGERVIAFVVADGRDLEVDAMRTRLREQLAPYQVPKRITQLTELPRNAMGKVDKAALRRQAGARDD